MKGASLENQSTSLTVAFSRETRIERRVVA
jgi:hypothetical protein